VLGAVKHSAPMTTLLALAALFVAGAPPPAAAPPKLDGRAAFEQLKKLEGNWKAEKEATWLQLRVISNGSAVLETMTGADRTKIVMTSVYSLDGNELVMTHYCGQGNQPFMKMKTAVPNLRLETVRVTNLPDPKGNHMSAVTFVVKDADNLTQEWDNTRAGTVSKIVFPFTREYANTLK